MASIRDSAIALRRYDYSETSQVLVFFTHEHGKVRALAKGVKRSTRKRFAAAVDLLDVGCLVCTRPGARVESLSMLTEWTQTRCFPGVRLDIVRIHAALYAAETTALLTEDWDAHPPLYEALLVLLADLSEPGDALAHAVRFQRVLLDTVGSFPRLDACVLCGRATDLRYFTSFEGGVMCRHCEPAQIEKRTVTAEVLSAMRGQPGAAGPAGAFETLDYHIAHLSGKAPRVGRRLLTLARRAAQCR